MSGLRQDISQSVTKVMTIEDPGGYTQVSKSLLCKLAQEGRVPRKKVGRHWRFNKAAINRWLVDASLERDA